MEKKTFLKTFNSTDRQCWCFHFNFRVFLLFEQRTAAPAAGIGSVGRLPMDADVQGGKMVQISRSQALLLPLPRPFSSGVADRVWAVHAMWATDFYLLLTNSLSLSDLYFYTVCICVIFTCVLFSLSEGVCTSGSNKADPADSVLSLPHPFTGAAEPWQPRRRCTWWLVCCLRVKERGQGEAQSPELRDWRAEILWWTKSQRKPNEPSQLIFLYLPLLFPPHPSTCTSTFHNPHVLFYTYSDYKCCKIQIFVYVEKLCVTIT